MNPKFVIASLIATSAVSAGITARILKKKHDIHLEREIKRATDEQFSRVFNDGWNSALSCWSPVKKAYDEFTKSE